MKHKFRSLELTAKTMINSFGSGSHASYLKDSIIEVDCVRQYESGDRKLDSKSSLRTGQTMARVFAPDKVMTVFMILDISASLYSKLEQAITTCLYLTYLADLVNDQVGLLTFSDKIHDLILPTHDGRNIIPVLESIYEKEAISGTTNLEQALLRFSTLETSNTLVVLISDFCYPITNKAIQFAKRAISGAGNKMIALALINNQEWFLEKQPFIVDFLDAESNDSVQWNFRSSQSRERRSSMFENWLKELKIKLRQVGAEPIIMPVDKNDYIMPLIKFLLK